MASSNPAAQDAPKTPMEYLSLWKSNFQTQSAKTFSDLRPKDYIRLVIIIGAYALLRPYLMKIGAKLQMRAHEKDAAEIIDGLTPNDLRVGQPKIAIPGLDSDDEEEDEVSTSGANWGRTARLRQRAMIREQLEAHERLLQEKTEEEEDKDIEEFLID